MSFWRDPGTGNWRIRILVEGERKVMKTLAGSLSHSQAKKIHDQEKARLSSRRVIGFPTFGELAAYYMETHAETLAPGWKAAIQSALQLHILPRFNNAKAEDMVPADVVAYLAKREKGGASPATVNRERSIILGILGHAERNRKIDRSPLPTRAVPKREEPTRKLIYFTFDEWRRFRDAFKDDDNWNQYVSKVKWQGPVITNTATGVTRRFGGGLVPGSEGAEAYRRTLAAAIPVFEFILLTGSRVGEVLGLRWSDVDWQGQKVSIYQPKTRKRKELFLAPEIVAVLKGVPPGEQDDLVFRPVGGAEASCWHPKRLAHAFDVARRLAGLRADLTPHALRRTAATWLYQDGQPIQASQALLGHASSQTTEKHYASLAPDNIEKIVRRVGQLATAEAEAR